MYRSAPARSRRTSPPPISLSRRAPAHSFDPMTPSMVGAERAAADVVKPNAANSMARHAPRLLRKLCTENFNPFDDRWCGEQFGRLLHERFGDGTIQMSV